MIIDEDQIVRAVAESILGMGGSPTVAFASIEEGLAIIAGLAPRRVTVLLSSLLAARETQAYATLLQIDPPPRVLLCCTRHGTCPLNPRVVCSNLGCIIKPDDFTPERLRSLVTGRFTPHDTEATFGSEQT